MWERESNSHLARQTSTPEEDESCAFMHLHAQLSSSFFIGSANQTGSLSLADRLQRVISLCDVHQIPDDELTQTNAPTDITNS